MRINNNNGHTINGKGSGAIGILNESICTRQIGNYFTKGMRSLGHTVFDCTIEKSTSYLFEAVNLANKNKVDYSISHHLNHSDDPTANGVEVWIYDLKDKETYSAAKKICDELAKLGFRNRGVKESQAFYWLRKTNDKSILIEYFFCSNKKDVGLYNPEKLANAVIFALTNKLPSTDNNNTSTNNNNTGTKKYVNGNYDCKGKVVNTNGTGLNIRTDRNTSSEVVGKLKEGSIVELDYCIDNWFSIWINGNKRFIHGGYIELVK